MLLDKKIQNQPFEFTLQPFFFFATVVQIIMIGPFELFQ